MECTQPATRATLARAAAFVSIPVRNRVRSPSTASLPPANLWSKESPMRQLCKGNVAVVKGAILAGCQAYYGYPITPASEIAEAAALLLPQVGATFLQAESEVAAINMVYGGAAG